MRCGAVWLSFKTYTLCGSERHVCIASGALLTVSWHGIVCRLLWSFYVYAMIHPADNRWSKTQHAHTSPRGPGTVGLGNSCQLHWRSCRPCNAPCGTYPAAAAPRSGDFGKGALRSGEHKCSDTAVAVKKAKGSIITIGELIHGQTTGRE